MKWPAGDVVSTCTDGSWIFSARSTASTEISEKLIAQMYSAPRGESITTSFDTDISSRYVPDAWNSALEFLSKWWMLRSLRCQEISDLTAGLGSQTAIQIHTVLHILHWIRSHSCSLVETFKHAIGAKRPVGNDKAANLSCDKRKGKDVQVWHGCSVKGLKVWPIWHTLVSFWYMLSYFVSWFNSRCVKVLPSV